MLVAGPKLRRQAYLRTADEIENTSHYITNWGDGEPVMTASYARRKAQARLQRMEQLEADIQRMSGR